MPDRHDKLDLHREIEHLRTQLKESNLCVTRLETQLAETVSEFEKEQDKLKEEIKRLRERYERLISNHQSLSKLNHELEASLISTIETANSEKAAFSTELDAVRSRLCECEKSLLDATAERDRYKEDCFVAATLLQANPDQFLPPVSNTTKTPPTTSRFSTFLPTFPPVGFPMFQMDVERADQQSTTHRLTTRGVVTDI